LKKDYDYVVNNFDMTSTNILDTDAYIHLQNKFEKAINEGPTYICNICIKFEYKKYVVKLNESKYDNSDNAFNNCVTQTKSIDGEKYVCLNCHRYLLGKKNMKGKIPPQAYMNNLQLNETIEELNDLCPLETSLVSQIIPFMFIVQKHKGAQHGLRGQVVLVPSDLEKVQKVLPRSYDEGHIISLELKRRLTDRSFHHRQNIRPAKVNLALAKLVEINPFYQNIKLSNSWTELSESADRELWEMLTSQNGVTENSSGSESADDFIDKEIEK